jgi:hypothetical protein
MLAKANGSGVCATSDPRMLKVGFELGDLGADAGELVCRGFTGEFQFPHRNRTKRRSRAVGPYGIERVGLDRHQYGAGCRRCLGKPVGMVRGVQPWVIAKARARRQVRLQPFLRRIVDQMLDGEDVGVDLVAHLQHIASVDEDHGAIGEHDRGSGRTGETGQPCQPRVGRRHVFALMPVGARHDEAIEPAPLQLGAQRRYPGRAGGALGRILECLEASFEHGWQSIEHSRERQPAGTRRLP